MGTPQQCQTLGTLREQPTLTGDAAWTSGDEQDVLSQLPHTSSQTLSSAHPPKHTGLVTLGVKPKMVWVTLGVGWTKSKSGLVLIIFNSPDQELGKKSALPNLKVSIPSYTENAFAACKALGKNHF